ncbi:carboxypeptidase regulatory-like domain-containing protein [Edaphobacter bradus]|uniref:carboxypeptidase regulatory-like domain-containing protein n=1 Tax=Edaphobacter bradus TaxID=2259016 RepID=UPI0021E00EEF|nr:carboxypeptidase regulatory-like domain-containing protein [Edaphobacter bradus]
MKPLINLLSKMSLLCGIAILLALSASHRSAFAQEAGQITGIVNDPSGAVVPNATVTVRNMGTNAIRSVTAGKSGEFVVPGLEPATYEVVIKSSGFQPFTARVEVTVAAKVALDARLSVTEATSVVEVTAAGGAQANTQTQELSQVINSTQVSQMPSLTRNPYDFIALAGNVSAGDSTNSGDSRGVSGGTSGNQQNAATRGVGFNINGQRSSGTEILLDGVENISVFTDGIGVFVPIDATQEFRVQTSNFEPQYGRASGGIINVTTKSGTNSYHGTVWEFNRLSEYTSNTVLNAQSGQPKGQYTRNQFGFAVGGPVLKNKLFAFGSTEWTRVRSTGVAFAGVPTPQFLALSAKNTQDFFNLYGGGTNFNFTKIYTAKDMGITGIPDSTPAFGTVAYRAAINAGGSVPQNTHNIVLRGDFNLSDKTLMFFRYADYQESDFSGTAFASPYSQYNVGAANSARAYLYSLSHVFNPSIASSTKLSFSRFIGPQTFDTKLQNVPTLIVIPNAQIPNTSTFIQLPGFYDFNPALGGLPFGGPQNTIQFNQDLNVQRGRHSMQFGGQIVNIQSNETYGAYAQASEQIGRTRPAGLQALLTGDLFQFQAAVNPKGALPCVRNPYTGALTKVPGCLISLPAGQPSFARSNRFWDWAVYAQDAFKLNPRLTLNYGVRYEYYGVQHNNRANLESNFYYGSGANLFEKIRNGQVYTTPNSPIRGLWNPQWGTASPRVGFALDIFGTGRTALRGGYGISYERNFGNVTFNVIQNPPNYAVIVINDVKITTSNSGPIGGGSGTVPLPPTSLRHVDQNIRTAQTQFWSGALEQQLAHNTVVSLQYAAARGVHLYDIKNINTLGGGNVLLNDPYHDTVSGKSGLTRLNSQYGNTNNRGSNGDSYYQAMNIQFQSTNLHNTGLSLVANYTLAHQLDDLSTTFSEDNDSQTLGYLEPFNPGFDRGAGSFDIRHRLVIAPIYRVPYFATGRGFKTQVLGGWQVTGIYTVRAGTPFTYLDSTNNNSGYQIARYVPAAGVVPKHTFSSIPASAKVNHAPNSYVIGTLPAAFSPGNAALGGISDWGPFPSTMVARNNFRGPGAWTFDASVSKIFPIHEQINVEFRAEGFDLLNHHNLFIQQSLNDVANITAANPLPTITASKGGIGNNSGANDERRFGQFALKINF